MFIEERERRVFIRGFFQDELSGCKYDFEEVFSNFFLLSHLCEIDSLFAGMTFSDYKEVLRAGPRSRYFYIISDTNSSPP